MLTNRSCVRLVAVIVAFGCLPNFALAQTGTSASTRSGGSGRKFFTRPVPLGVSISNDQVRYVGANFFCSGGGTLGAVVEDQNQVQYLLGNAHVIALGALSILSSGAAAGIYQPDLAITPQPPGSGLHGTCGIVPANKIGNLTTVVAPLAATGNEVDAAIAQIIPGTVGNTFFSGPATGPSSVPASGFAKGGAVQMVGSQTGLISGVISKVGAAANVNVCLRIAKALSGAGCEEKVVRFANQIVVKPTGKSTNFGVEGDSGALVMTTDTCPQPVGLFHAGVATTKVGVVSPITTVLQQLEAAGGYSELSIVPGCTPSEPQMTQDEQADRSMTTAQQAQADESSYFATYIQEGVVAAVAIDLSSGTAVIDVEVDDPSGSTFNETISSGSYQRAGRLD